MNHPHTSTNYLRGLQIDMRDSSLEAASSGSESFSDVARHAVRAGFETPCSPLSSQEPMKDPHAMKLRPRQPSRSFTSKSNQDSKGSDTSPGRAKMVVLRGQWATQTPTSQSRGGDPRPGFEQGIYRRDSFRQRRAVRGHRNPTQAPSPPSTSHCSANSSPRPQPSRLADVEIKLHDWEGNDQVTQYLKNAVSTIRGEREAMLQRLDQIDSRMEELKTRLVVVEGQGVE